MVLPVASHAEKAATYVNWEGRARPSQAALTTNAMSDHRVLDMLADELGVFLQTRTHEQIHQQWQALGPWTGSRAVPAAVTSRAAAGMGQVALATWPTLLDRGRLQDGEPFLAGTAPRAVARLGRALAERLVQCGDPVVVATSAAAVTVPAKVTEDMVDGVVWLPTNSAGCAVRRTLGVDAGARVTVTKGGAS